MKRRGLVRIITFTAAALTVAVIFAVTGWIKVGEYRVAVMKQHARFLLDEKPVRWKDRLWLWWHADDGFMLEQYHEADEELLSVPDTES